MNSSSPNVRSLLERRTPATPTSVGAVSGEVDQEGDYSAFAYGRIGRNGQFTLMFRMADGSARGFAYAHLYGIESEDPDVGFAMDFTNHRVTIRGRNLGTLLRLIGQHRVEEIREADRALVFAGNSSDPVVEGIDVAGSDS